MKNKTKSKRWHLTPFMRELIGRMKKNSTIIMATNIEKYALEFEQSMEEKWGLFAHSKQAFNLESFEQNQLKFRTHFEKKYLLDGQTIFNFEYKLHQLI